MAIENNRQDQQGTLSQGSSGLMGVGGPQAATGNATKPTVRKTKGSGFVGLQSYLTSNPNAGQQASRDLLREQTGLGQKIEQNKQQISGQIQTQKATGMGQQYNDVSMAGVSNLQAEQENLMNKAKALETGDYTKYAAAQGYKPMTAGESALFGGMMGAQSQQFAPQATQVASQDAVGAALKGLSEQQTGQRKAFDEAVAQYQKQYNDYQTEMARQAALENAARQQSSIMDRMRMYQQPLATSEAQPVDQGSMFDGNSTAANINRIGQGIATADLNKLVQGVGGAGLGAATTIKDVGNKTSSALKKAKKKIFG